VKLWHRISFFEDPTSVFLSSVVYSVKPLGKNFVCQLAPSWHLRLLLRVRF
jgi:hypothetical protein